MITYLIIQIPGEYIDDTEDLINIQLDFARNRLIRFDILLTTGAAYGSVGGSVVSGVHAGRGRSSMQPAHPL